MTRILKSGGIFLSALFAAGVLMPSPVAAETDFSGKTIKIIAPFKESGGTARYARLWQKYLQEYLPGKPTVLVIFKPGGSGITGANWFQKNAKTDGTNLVALSSSSHTSYLFGGKKVRFKTLTWRPIILSPMGSEFYARTDIGVKGKNIVDDIKALQKANVISGGKNPTSAELRGYIAYDLLGLKNIKYVFGLDSGDRRKAVLRNELNLTYDTAGSFAGKTVKYIKKGVVAHFMTLGFVSPEGKLVRDPAFPNVPNVAEAYKAVYGKEPSGPAWQALKHLIFISVMSSKSMYLPAGTSDEILNTYINTVKKIMEVPSFKKVAKKELGGYPQTLGKEAATFLKEAIDVSPETRAWIAKFLKKKFDYNMM